MKKNFLFPMLFTLTSFSILNSCSDNNCEDDILQRQPFYVVATSGPFGKISPYGVIKMKEPHPKFRFIPNRGYSIDSVIVNGLAINITKEFTFSKIDEKINTIRVSLSLVAYSLASNVERSVFTSFS